MIFLDYKLLVKFVVWLMMMMKFISGNVSWSKIKHLIKNPRKSIEEFLYPTSGQLVGTIMTIVIAMLLNQTSESGKLTLVRFRVGILYHTAIEVAMGKLCS